MKLTTGSSAPAMIRRVHRVLVFCVVAVCFASALARAAAMPMREITPHASNDVLMNPGTGVYLYGTRNEKDMPADAWFSPIVTIAYCRDDWSKLQPDGEGVYKFDEYFNPIFDLWVKKWHKRVSFRFMSENMHSRQKYVTPKWVFDKGVPSVTLKGLYVPEQIDPVFWDDRYLAIQERFIADLGKYLDGRPGLEFIDIGCIGEWGEMHLARWTPELLQQSGYTESKYISAYRRIIDAFARAFPRMRVFLNVGDYDCINDYAAIRGLHFRQDGLNPAGPSANVGKRFYQPYSRRGVICNYELFSGYSEMQQKGWGIPETFKKGLEDPISYFHINLMGYRELLNAPAEVKESVTDLARRLGYRFVLEKVRCNEAVRLDGTAQGRLLIDSTWKNLGVAPCYESYALRWSLVNDKGVSVAESLTYPKRPTTQWWPGEETTLHCVISVPAGTLIGSYRLKVAMVKPEQPELRIALGIAGLDSEGGYVLGEIAVQKGEVRQSLPYEEGFETGVGGWHGAQGITLHQDDGAHAGKGCVLMEGTQPGNSWNYASFNLPPPLLPASRYRFSCWMKVDAPAPAKAPYLKLGLADSAGKWIANCATNHYDIGKLGTWQLLQGFAETTPETAGGHMAIEKGSLEQKTSVTLRIDDLKLELLESP